MSKTGLQVLTDARPFIADHWTRGTLREMVSGNVCAIGAVLASRYAPEQVKTVVSYENLDDGNGAREAVEALFAALPAAIKDTLPDKGFNFASFEHRYGAIIYFNDNHEQTQADVLALFDRAIEALS